MPSPLKLITAAHPPCTACDSLLLRVPAALPALQPVSVGEARFINLQFHTLSSTPYLAYSDLGINGGAAVVRRWG